MQRSTIDKQVTATIAVMVLLALGMLAWDHFHPPKSSLGPTSPDTGAMESGAGITDDPATARERYPTGYTPDPAATKEFLRSLPKPTIREAGPDLFRGGGAPADGQPVLLYRALYKAHQAKYGTAFSVGRQGIGDCVSWGWAHAANIHLAVMWELGDSAEWHDAATEAIYGGSRVEARGKTFGGWSDGSYGSAAAKWVRDWGCVFRQRYDGVDLTTYSATRAKDWGAYGCGGKSDNGALDTIAKQHPVRDVALVRSFEEAAAAIASGYPVAVCSMQGFASSRDSDGFARASGSWAHCMCFIGVRYDRPGLLCLNSWGATWISGPKWPADQPEGSFWVEAAVATRMLSGGDSFAVSGYEGFPYRPLDHGNWVMVQPKQYKWDQAVLDMMYAVAP